jgi:hypothetical protein
MQQNKKPFIIKRNDTLPALSVTLKTRGVAGELIPVNLSGVSSCTFSMADTDGSLKVFSSQAQITSMTGGTIQYNWTVGDTDMDGTFVGEFELVYSDGNKQSVPILGGLDIQILKDINEA